MPTKILYKYNDPLNKGRRRALRQDQTKAEEVLWEELRDRRLLGYKWRRQCGIGPFIADFYCAELLLIIELDGPVHEEQIAYDAFRDSELAKRRLRIIRFKNDEVLFDRERVMKKIKEYCIQQRFKMNEG